MSKKTKVNVWYNFFTEFIYFSYDWKTVGYNFEAKQTFIALPVSENEVERKEMVLVDSYYENADLTYKTLGF